MTFGKRVRQIRQARSLTLRELAEIVQVNFTYLSKIENGKLDFGDYPSETLIHRLADALCADEEELLLLAEKVPERIRQRVIERPDAFREIAALDDEELDGLLSYVRSEPKGKEARRRIN